ncbi:unnamed protein product [Ixodes persulcatus]
MVNVKVLSSLNHFIREYIILVSTMFKYFVPLLKRTIGDATCLPHNKQPYEHNKSKGVGVKSNGTSKSFLQLHFRCMATCCMTNEQSKCFLQFTKQF